MAVKFQAQHWEEHQGRYWEGEGLTLQQGLSPCSTFFAERGRGAMYGQRGKLMRVGRYLAQGMSIRAAARRAGCSKNTARKLHRILLAERIRRGEDDFRCACGRPSIHQGWCPPRFRQSVKRQEVLRKMHKRRRNDTK